MLSKNYFFYLIGLLVILQSCSSTRNIYYAPEESNMLKLAQKNDLKAAVSSSNITNEGDSNDFSHINAQIAYSPIKYLGVFGSFLNWNSAYTNFNFPSSQSSNNYKAASGAIGSYYFFQTDTQKMRDDTVASLPIGYLIDVYVGTGRGKVKNDYSPASNSLLKFTKTYAQIGIHWQDEYVGLSVVHRFGQINFFEGVLNGNSEEAYHYFNHLEENKKQKFRETSYKLFMGTKELRGYVNVTIVNLNERIPFDNSTFFYSDRLPHVEAVMNIGVVLGIDEIYKYFKKNKH